MDFEFSAEQEMLRESVRAFLAATPPSDAWDGLCSLGVLGLPMVDSAVVLEELGRVVSPAPFASSVAASGFRAASERTVLAIFESGARYDWRAPSTRCDGASLRGEKVHVLDGIGAEALLVSAADAEGAVGVYEVSGADAAVVPEDVVDITRNFAAVTIDGAPARLIGSAERIGPTLDRLGVALAVDGVGAAQRALELAVDYAKERVQFDKPIGSFQAVQHLCADMLRVVELGRAAAYYACWAIDEASESEAHRAATIARAYTSDAFPQLGATAIQVFGGIGFTWEHEIHRYYKRLLTCSLALGTASDHLAELAHLAIDD